MVWASGDTIVASRIEDRYDRDIVNGYAGIDKQKLIHGSIISDFNILKIAASGQFWSVTESNSGNIGISNISGSLSLNTLGRIDSLSSVLENDKYSLSSIPHILTFKIDSFSYGSSGICTEIGYGSDINSSSLVDSYGIEEYNSWDWLAQHQDQMGQAITNSNKIKLYSIQWYLAKNGSPTGNIFANVFTCNGTPGTDGIGVGSPLVISNPVDATTISTTYALVKFTFPQPYTLLTNTNYVITCGYSGGLYTTDSIKVGLDNAGPTHPGNNTYRISGVWITTTNDLLFYAFGDSTLKIGIKSEDSTSNWIFKTYNGTAATSSNIVSPSSADVFTMYVTANRAALIKNDTWIATHTTNLPLNGVGRFAELNNSVSGNYSAYIVLSFFS